MTGASIPAAPRARGGFTLIEVLITLVILATGIVTVLQAFQAAANALGQARDTLYANHLLNRMGEDAEAGRDPGNEPQSPPFDVYQQAFAAVALPDEPGVVHWTASIQRDGSGAVFRRDWYRAAP